MKASEKVTESNGRDQSTLKVRAVIIKALNSKMAITKKLSNESAKTSKPYRYHFSTPGCSAGDNNGTETIERQQALWYQNINQVIELED
ncbi:MAG: hypothetical protein JKY36_06925 [Erythrobacter sp.]|nr:hypothetical protein [Erythrobacter sp.]